MLRGADNVFTCIHLLRGHGRKGKYQTIDQKHVYHKAYPIRNGTLCVSKDTRADARLEL